MAVDAGAAIRAERGRRRWTLAELGGRAGLSTSHIQGLEAGDPASLEAYARVMTALGLRPSLSVQGREAGRLRQDLVHAAMAELETTRLRRHGFDVAVDEPYQHFQFAGRADVLGWDVGRRALLHIENRTQFPNVQEALGSYSAKRAYLAPVLATRLALPSGDWLSVTHVIVALWSAEVLHVVRQRRETFMSACPDAVAAFEAWWHGHPPARPGVTSTFVLLDPGRVRESFRLASLDQAMTVRPRYRDYAETAAALRVG